MRWRPVPWAKNDKCIIHSNPKKQKRSSKIQTDELNSDIATKSESSNLQLYLNYWYIQLLLNLNDIKCLSVEWWNLTVARVAENSPKNPINGFDFALSVLNGAITLNRTNIMVLMMRVPVIDSLLFSISQAGVFDTNIPT